MCFGPLIMALGLVYMALSAEVNTNYFIDLLPGILILGVGLSATVTPLTSAVLSDVDSNQAGIASAVNNAISRIAGLLAVAIIGALMAASFSGSVTRSAGIHSLSNSDKAYLLKASSDTLDVHVPGSVHDKKESEDILRSASTTSLRTSLFAMAGLLTVGGITSGIGIVNKKSN
jgi:hypothetical protein